MRRQQAPQGWLWLIVLLMVVFNLFLFSRESPERLIFLLLVLCPWLLGPVLIRCNQWSSARPCLVPCHPDHAGTPSLIRCAALELKPLGFVHLRTFELVNQVPNVKGFESLYYNPSSLDVARVIVGLSATTEVSYYLFSSELSSGEEIYTSNSRCPLVTPPVPQVRTMAFPGIHEPARLYTIHRARVKFGLRCRPKIDDPHAYVLSKETRALNNYVARGYYSPSEDGRRLVPTWKGAVLMTWKSLWPVPPIRRAWRRLRAWFALRSLPFEENGGLYDSELDGVARSTITP